MQSVTTISEGLLSLSCRWGNSTQLKLTGGSRDSQATRYMSIGFSTFSQNEALSFVLRECRPCGGKSISASKFNVSSSFPVFSAHNVVMVASDDQAHTAVKHCFLFVLHSFRFTILSIYKQTHYRDHFSSHIPLLFVCPTFIQVHNLQTDWL